MVNKEDNMISRRFLAATSAAIVLGFALPVAAQPAAETPEAFVKRLSDEVLTAIKNDKGAQSGELARITALIDNKIMPNVNFERMTASTVGPAWRQASAQQKTALQTEFRRLLERTYAGALGQIGEVQLTVKPVRAADTDTDVLVRTEVRGKGDPIQLDYRLEKNTGAGPAWKIYNLNVLGVWLVETYRTQFSQEINTKGLDGLIASLAERNKANAKKS